MIRLLLGALVASAIAIYVHIEPMLPAAGGAFAQQGGEAFDKRQRQLEERERALDQREALLKAAEQRIAEKIAEMKGLQAKLESQSRKPAAAPAAPGADESREEQFKRLVRVYGNMKPREAARLFEQMEQALLLDLAQRMRDFKLAPILAAMEPKKASTLTAELAKRRALPRPAPAAPTGG